MYAKVQRIMHIIAAIKQKSASNSQILLKFCSIVVKIAYICKRIPPRAVSKDIVDYELAFAISFEDLEM